MVRYLPFLISLALSIYALFSCIQTRDEDVPYLPKLIWVLLIVLVPFVGPITWILMSRAHYRKKSAASGHAGGSRGPGLGGPDRPVSRPRPVAPDDDPEFLAWLDRNRPAKDDQDRPASDQKPPEPSKPPKPKQPSKPPKPSKPADTGDANRPKDGDKPAVDPDEGDSGDRAAN